MFVELGNTYPTEKKQITLSLFLPADNNGVAATKKRSMVVLFKCTRFQNLHNYIIVSTDEHG